MDKIDNESVESSNCDSLRIEKSPSDDIETTNGIVGYWGEKVYWFVEIARVLFKRSIASG